MIENTLQLPGSSSANLAKIHEASAKFQRYKILLRRRWWFLLLTASIGVCFQALRIAGKPPAYVSLAKLVAGGRMVSQQSVAQYSEYLQDFYGTIIETLQSSEMSRRAKDRVRNLNPDIREADVEVRVTQNRGSAIFNVASIGSDSKYTQLFLDALLNDFRGFRESQREQQKDKALQTIADEVSRKDRELQEIRIKLDSFAKAYDMVLVSQGHNQAADILRNRNTELEALKLKESEAKATIEGVDGALQQRQRGPIDSGTASTSANINSSGPDVTSLGKSNGNNQLGFTPTEKDYLDTKREILLLKAERDQLLKVLRPMHPDVAAVDDKVEKLEILLRTLEKQIQDEMQSQLKGLQNSRLIIEEAIKENTIKAKDAAKKIAEYEGLKKQAELSELGYKEILEKFRQFQMSEELAGDAVSVMEPATPALQEVEEPWMPLALGLVAGLAGGIMILLLFDRLDDRMNSFSEFQSLFPNEPILGQVPDQRRKGDVALLKSSDDRHLYAEAFRNLRSSILFKNWNGKSPKSILVTSAVPNEGKTTVTSNLAITMALAGARVLLADCDLRRGGVNELFKLPVSPGLSEVLRGKTHWRDAVQETNVRNLELLTRGEVFDQTSEMLLSRTTDEILKEMSEEYDYVIFDSAPVLVADDTASFAPKLDTVLFVVRMSSTMARLTSKALELLYNRQVRMGGVILNRSSSSLKEYTYYNYASYYYTPKVQDVTTDGSAS